MKKLEYKGFEKEWEVTRFVNECYDGFIKTPVSITYNGLKGEYVLFYTSEKV